MHPRFQTTIRSAMATLALAGGFVATGALAAGSHSSGHGQVDFGEPGKPAEASRTVTVIMGDIFFEPEKIEVKAGETVRFVVKNQGEALHEFNIGVAEMHKKHQEEMAMMMEHGMITVTSINRDKTMMDHAGTGTKAMAHDDPNSVLLEPGKSGEIVWKFAKPMDLEFACNIPGHYESGMVGNIDFVRKVTSIR